MLIYSRTLRIAPCLSGRNSKSLVRNTYTYNVGNQNYSQIKFCFSEKWSFPKSFSRSMYTYLHGISSYDVVFPPVLSVMIWLAVITCWFAYWIKFAQMCWHWNGLSYWILVVQVSFSTVFPSLFSYKRFVIPALFSVIPKVGEADEKTISSFSLIPYLCAKFEGISRDCQILYSNGFLPVLQQLIKDQELTADSPGVNIGLLSPDNFEKNV